MIPREKLDQLQTELHDTQDLISDPAIINDAKRYRDSLRRFKELGEINQAWKHYQQVENHIAEVKELLAAESDADMAEMIKEEAQSLDAQLEMAEQKLRDMLIPSDPNDSKNAIIEIRAGTGGEEAALFVANLYRMYNYYAQLKGWKLSLLDSNETGLGGYKELIFQLNGDGVYGLMRFESGVHRVQRIPVTESGGRIHTSAVSVAVLPEAEDIDVELIDSEIRIDVYRSSGNGGQSVNTTDSAVRITHLPTGIVVTCQDEKSQIKNKAKALKVLRSRLLDAEISRQEQEIASSRKAQVSTGDRSAKIRTYNFPQSRVTDHRINLTSYNLDAFLAGNIDEFIQSLRIAWRNEKVNA
ncbi:MAG: peptide chain release factor 1 [Candidatus Cloacimonas sp.]|nr:peptide chain release factor 1 [Candidatus Cloacimonas sp.]